MSDISTRIVISARDEASATLKQINREAETLTGRWSGMQTAMAAGLGAVGVAGVSASLSGALQSAAQYEVAVTDMAKVTARSSGLIREDIAKIPPALGDATSLMAGYYQVYSAGITDAASAQDMLLTASMTAKAAHVAQADTITALTKLIAGYSGEITNAADASDLLFAIEKQGQTSVQELVPIIGDLASVSKQAGVSANEMGAVFSAITQTAGGTAQAATQYRSVIMSLIKPTENMRDLLKSMGYASGEALIQQKGTISAFLAIKDAAAKSGKQLGEFFESSEALTALGPLFNTSFAQVKTNMEVMAEKTDMASSAYERFSKTFTAQTDEAVNRAKNLSTAIGEMLAPTAISGMKSLNSGLGYFAENLDTVANGALTLGAGIAALTISRKLDVTEAARQFAADTQLHGVQNTLADRILGVDSAQRQRMATQNALQSNTVRSAQAAVSEAQSLQRTTVAAEADAQAKHAQAVAARESALTSRQVQNALANEAATLSTLHAAQTRTFAATNTLNAAQQNLVATTARVTASLTTMTVAQTAMHGLRAAGSGLLTMLGGPWGVAFTAAAVGAMYLATKEDEGAKFARDHAEAMSLVTDNAGDAASSMKAYADSIQNMTAAQLDFERAVKQGQIDKVLASGGNNYSRIFTEFSSFIPTKEETARLMQFNKILPSNFSKTTTEELRGLIEEMMRLGSETKKIEEATHYIEDFLKPLLALKLQQEELSKTSSSAANSIAGMGSAAATAYSPLSSLKEILDAINKAEISPEINAGYAVEQLQKDLKSTKVMQDQALAATKARTAENLAIMRKQVEIARVEQQARERLAAANSGGEFAESARQGAAELAEVEGQLKTFTAAAEQLGKKTKEASKTASTLKSLTSELAKLQMTDAQYEQWKVAQKIAELEKALGKANPKVKELKAALEKELSANLLQSITEYADPAAGQLSKLQKEYQKILDTIKGDKGVADDQKALFNTQAARQYEKALEGVAGSAQFVEKVAREQKMTEAELSGNRTLWWKLRREQLEEEYGLKSSIADKEKVNAAIDNQLKIERMQKESEYSFNFAKMWEETYKRVDEAGANMIEGFLTGSKNGLDSLKTMFIRTLSEMANAALLRPITVSVMGTMGGVMGGMFGGNGTANAAGQALGGGGGGMPNLPISSMLPDSWKTGISDGVTGAMRDMFPSLFGSTYAAAPALSGVSFMSGATSAGSAAYGGMGGVSFLNGAVSPAGNAAYGGMGGVSFLNGTGSGVGVNTAGAGAGIGSGLMYGGIGSAVGGMASPYFNDMLGINNGKNAQIGSTVGGMGSTAVMAGLAAANMWNPGGWVMAGVAALSSLFGGSMGGLFDKKPKKPAVWSGLELNLGTDLPGYDFSNTFDPKGYGKDAYWTAEQDQYAIASRARNKTPNTVADSFGKMLSEIADNGIAQAEAMQKALPDSYAKAFKEQLAVHQVSGSWDLKGDDINEENLKKVAEELQTKINDSMLLSFQGMDFGDYAEKITVDQSTLDGMTRFTTAIKLTEDTIKATAEISDPISQLEQEANSAKAQLEEWSKAMESAGVTTQYAGKLVGDYNSAMITKFIGDMETSINPLSQYAQAQKDANTAVDDRLAALKILGATEEQLAQVEGMRSQVLESVLEPMRTAFEQDMRVREAQLAGNADLLSSIQLTVQHEKELADVRAKFGAESAEYARTQGIQLQELAQLHQQAAQAVADAMSSMQQSLQLRLLNAAGDNNGASVLNLQMQHQKELADARKQAVTLTEQQLLQAKAATMNAEGVDGGGWTSDKVFEAITNAGMSIKEWFDRFGKNEGYGSIGAGYVNSAYEDTLRAVQEAERNALLLGQNLSGAASEAARLKSEYDEKNRELEQAKSAQQNILSQIESSVRQLKGFSDAVKAAADALGVAREQLWQGDANLSTESRLASVQIDFERTFALAMSGDSEAAKELPGIGNTLLSLYKETASSSEEYNNAFYEVDKKLRLAQDAQLREYNLQKSQYDALMKQYGLQETQAQTQAQILAKIQEYQAELATANKTVLDAQKAAAAAQQAAAEAAAEAAAREAAAQAAAIKAAQDAAEAARKAAEEAAKRPTPTPPPKPTPPPAQPTGPYNGKTQDQILAEKVSALNRGEGVTGAADHRSWTASKFLQYIQQQGFDFDHWWKTWGKAEGFASGGITPVNLTSWAGMQTPFWTGERGPELVVSPQSYGVLNNKDSAELMRTISVPPTMTPVPARGDSELRAEIRQLREELKASRTENTMLLSQVIIALNNIRADTRSIDDMLDDGIVVKPEGATQ